MTNQKLGICVPLQFITADFHYKQNKKWSSYIGDPSIAFTMWTEHLKKKTTKYINVQCADHSTMKISTGKSAYIPINIISIQVI